MADAAAKEPSMEEILASIRRIIAEEGEESATDSSVPSEPDVSNQAGSFRQTENQEPIVGLSDGLQPGISVTNETPKIAGAAAAPAAVEAEASPREVGNPQREEMTPSTSGAPQTEATPPVQPVSPAQPAPIAQSVPASQSTPTSPEQAMSLANIAAGIKRPVSGDQQTRQPPAIKTEAPAQPAKPSQQAKPVQPVAAPASKPVASGAQAGENQTSLQPEQQVLKVRLSNPEKPPEQFVSRVREAKEIADKQKEAEEAASFKGALMSPDTTEEVTGSFERLRNTQGGQAANAGLEAQTERLLRKMLREWLDENLPTLVERLVREEIERVARG